MTFELRLTNGSIALINDEDAERVTSAGNWYEDERGHGKRTYVYRRFHRKKVYLHKFILDYDGPDDIDHDDGNGLNCQRSNLIIRTRTQNNLNNHHARSDNTTGIRGVHWDSTYQGYKAEIKIKGRKFNLGVHPTKELAAEARRIAEDRISQGLHPKYSNQEPLS